MWSPLWSILLCKIPQLFAKSFLFGQLIRLFEKKDTMMLPKIHIMFCPTVGAKYPFVSAPAHDITTKKQDEWSRVQSNIQWLIICRFLSQLRISTRYTELQLYEKFQLVLKIFQHRLKYGVIHIARTHNGRGEGSNQMRPIACKENEDCFMTSKKEDNVVKLRQYLEIFYNRFVQERCFQAVSRME